MEKKTVLVSHNLPREPFYDLMQRFEVIFPTGERFSKEELAHLLPRADALIPTYGFKVRPEVMDMAPRLKIIANYGVGYDNIDIAAATERGIVVTNNPIPVLEPTAEHTYALLLSLAHRIPECDRDMRNGQAKWGVMDNMGTTVLGKTLGIVGLGRIGRALVRYARASQMRILYHNRHRLSQQDEQALGVEYRPFDTLLTQADIISVHLPSNAESYHLFGPDQFRQMKPTALFINTARGPIVDEEALSDALRSSQIAGAALDVYEHEPQVHPALLELDNVVLTPHTGTNTYETRYGMSYHAARNVLRFFDGHLDIDRVN